MFRGDKVVKCSVLKEVRLTVEEMLKCRAVSDTVRRFDEELQAEITRLWSKVKYCERRAASCSTAASSRKNRGNKRYRAGSIGVGTGEREALNGRKESVTEQTREFGFFVAQYIKKIGGTLKACLGCFSRCSLGWT